MGDGAYMALCYAEATEVQLDSYLTGNMTDFEAYENSLIDYSGRLTSEANDYLSKLQIGESNELDTSIRQYVNDLEHVTSSVCIKSKYPKCNCCKEAMSPRMGKYGKFYYCSNGCKDQSTVSDTYWQKCLTR